MKYDPFHKPLKAYRVDEGPECNPHNGNDVPYPDEPNYLISKDSEKLRFQVSLPGNKDSTASGQVKAIFLIY